MAWKNLESIAELDAIIEASFSQPQLIFKHSTRCGISSGAKFRLDDDLENLGNQYSLHLLDLLQHRDISAQIANQFSVTHQSPQILLIENGKAVVHLNHYRIAPSSILAAHR